MLETGVWRLDLRARGEGVGFDLVMSRERKGGFSILDTRSLAYRPRFQAWCPFGRSIACRIIDVRPPQCLVFCGA